MCVTLKLNHNTHANICQEFDKKIILKIPTFALYLINNSPFKMSINTPSKTADAAVAFPPLFDLMQEMEHEQVLFCYDPPTGLKAIIAVHNTVLGPSLGGTRIWSYANDSEAVIDALRLSRGMTYKAAVSGLNLGGGKGVIIGNSRTDKTEPLLRRYGQFVDSLNGKYLTAEDVGMTAKDMMYIGMETEFVTGLPEYIGGSGEPSIVTAYGVYMGIKAAVQQTWNNDSLNGKSVAIQGVGSVGEHLIELLHKENANIVVTDINKDRLDKMVNDYGVKVVGLDDIYEQEVDIFSPCALGAILNDKTIPRLKCRIIAGAANNQLEDEQIHDQALTDKGILYAPDFLINAGGIINIYSRDIQGGTLETAKNVAEEIYGRTLQVIRNANDHNITTHQAAIQIAQERIGAIAKLKAKL